MNASPAVERVDLAGEDAFSYGCTRCGRCCYNKRIQVNPYEIARLARNLEFSAAEVRARYTVDGQGVILKQAESGACVFLGAEGCGVHPDRPLVCRLYPLGRHIEEGGRIWFSHVELEPPPGGRYGAEGTVSEFVRAQGAEPFIAAADDYFFWFCAAWNAVPSPGEAVPSPEEIADEHTKEDPANLLDLDIAVERHCAEAGIDTPQDLEERRRIHLEILHQQLR